MSFLSIFIMLGGLKNVISSDPPFVERLVQFTTVPIKPLTDQGYQTFSTKTILIAGDFVFKLSCVKEIIIFTLQMSQEIDIFV